VTVLLGGKGRQAAQL